MRRVSESSAISSSAWWCVSSITLLFFVAVLGSVEKSSSFGWEYVWGELIHTCVRVFSKGFFFNHLHLLPDPVSLLALQDQVLQPQDVSKTDV